MNLSSIAEQPNGLIFPSYFFCRFTIELAPDTSFTIPCRVHKQSIFFCSFSRLTVRNRSKERNKKVNSIKLHHQTDAHSTIRATFSTWSQQNKLSWRISFPLFVYRCTQADAPTAIFNQMGRRTCNWLVVSVSLALVTHSIDQQKKTERNTWITIACDSVCGAWEPFQTIWDFLIFHWIVQLNYQNRLFIRLVVDASFRTCCIRSIRCDSFKLGFESIGWMHRTNLQQTNTHTHTNFGPIVWICEGVENKSHRIASIHRISVPSLWLIPFDSLCSIGHCVYVCVLFGYNLAICSILDVRRTLQR